LQLLGMRPGSTVRLYARSKRESLETAVFLLDPHVNVAQNTTLFKDKSAYRPSTQRFVLTNTTYVVAKGYANVFGIPAGDHVLTVLSDPHNPTDIAGLTHLVVFQS
jgi:hypothetical protein